MQYTVLGAPALPFVSVHHSRIHKYLFICICTDSRVNIHTCLYLYVWTHTPPHGRIHERSRARIRIDARIDTAAHIHPNICVIIFDRGTDINIQ
jgi:hypothetical protein